jgi:regulation of enolase protein 1 (concanavalin A-like superfamily)
MEAPMSKHAQALPFGLRWEVEPTSWHLDGSVASVVAAASTDNFVDPAGTTTALDGARALADAPQRAWQLSAKVTVDFHAAYDAGALLLWSDDQHFAKLCFEHSPQGEPMVVSVITRGVSDDANAWIVDGDTVWLRISKVADEAYAFHSSSDGRRWELVRYFALSGSGPMRYGISAQSPTGDGCAVTFEDLALSDTHLANLRDGS